MPITIYSPFPLSQRQTSKTSINGARFVPVAFQQMPYDADNTSKKVTVKPYSFALLKMSEICNSENPSKYYLNF